MSTRESASPPTAQPARRVREHVKDGLAVIGSSLVAATTLAIVLTLVTKLAG